MLHLPGEAGNVLHIHSNDFVYAFFVFFCGHLFVASRLKVHFALVLGWLGARRIGARRSNRMVPF